VKVIDSRGSIRPRGWVEVSDLSVVGVESSDGFCFGAGCGGRVDASEALSFEQVDNRRLAETVPCTPPKPFEELNGSLSVRGVRHRGEAVCACPATENEKDDDR
jgi:hypothetical protein